MRPRPKSSSPRATALRSAGLLIYPTDTLYALGGLALEPGVGERVRGAKGRADGQPLPLIAADTGQARALCRELAGRGRPRWPRASGPDR